MKKSPESLPNENRIQEEQSVQSVRDKNIASVAMDAAKSTSGEVSGEVRRGVDIVRDHFPEDISPKERFERDNGPNPLKTEEDYKEAFDLFRQEELIPKYHAERGGRYSLEPTYRPYQETVRTYLWKTEDTIKDLSGESGKLPETDVAIYLDKSARPVSWFVNELWEDFTDKPRPQTAHLAIDRRIWFRHFKVGLSQGEYVDDDTGRLAGWRDLPIHDVTQDEMSNLWSLLRDKVLTHEELDAILGGVSDISNRIKGRAIDAVIREKGNLKTQAELDLCVKEGLDSIKILNNAKRLKNTYDACMIAAQIRGLFVPGGLSEEDVKNPERIMDYPVGMEGKNITIIDEVARTGTTGEIAEHFIKWAFPEAGSVNFYVFYEAKRLHDANSPMDGQMLMIPFWYSLRHDDRTGRGINDRDPAFYEKAYKDRPDNNTRAAKFGSDFLGVPMDYEKEAGQNSLRLRRQIARLREEYEKSHIV